MVHEKVSRVEILKVPVDIVQPEDLEDVIKSLFDDDRNHHLVLLSMADLMRARRSGEFRTYVNQADLVIPISRSIISTARFIKRREPVRYEPFDFIIRAMATIERWNRSIYFFGSSKKHLGLAEKNIRDTFPQLRIVGRHSGYVSKAFMPQIIQAIRKATPTLLLVGRGVHGGERWIQRNLKNFESGLYLWCSDVLDVFAKKRHRPSKTMFDHGSEWLHYLPGRPWNIFRIYTWFRMKMIALWYRLRRY